MKTFQKNLFVVLAFAFMSFTATANTYTGGEPNATINKELRKEIVSHIDSPTLRSADKVQLRVSFIITKNNEVLVTNVDTDNSYIESYIKSNLNYKKIETNGIETNSPYHVKVTYTKE